MFGSLGWGLAMFFVGIALDHSTAFSEHPCGPDLREKNYTICFAIFSVLMGAALITATQINFKYDVVASEPVRDRVKLQNYLSFDRVFQERPFNVADKNVRSNDAGDSRMGNRVETIQRLEVRLLPLRSLVHGLRYRIDLHLPVLAPSGLRWYAHVVRRRFRDQSHIRDIRLLLQLQVDSADRSREGSTAYPTNKRF